MPTATAESLRQAARPPTAGFQPQTRTAGSTDGEGYTSDLQFTFAPNGEFAFDREDCQFYGVPGVRTRLTGHSTVAPDGTAVTVESILCRCHQRQDPCRCSGEVVIEDLRIDAATREVRCFFDGDETPGKHMHYPYPYYYGTTFLPVEMAP